MNGLKIYTDGRMEVHDIKESEFEYKFEALQKAIDCDCIDIVHASNLPSPYCMVVDDESLLKEKPIINLVASYLYGADEHGQPICGDVIIMKDEFTDEGIETAGLDDMEVERLKSYLESADVSGKVVITFLKLKEIIEGNES